jgi:hypothetical protein
VTGSGARIVPRLLPERPDGTGGDRAGDLGRSSESEKKSAPARDDSLSRVA